jgi:hypothetical protein
MTDFDGNLKLGGRAHVSGPGSTAGWSVGLTLGYTKTLVKAIREGAKGGMIENN